MSRAVEFLYLSMEDVIAAGGLDIGTVIEDEAKAYSMLDQGLAEDPVAPQIHFEGKQSGRIMAIHPSWLGGDVNVAGMKLGARAPENPKKFNLPSICSLIELINPDTGHPIAVMDGTFITAVRTGCTTGVGARFLARPDSEVVGLLGAGVMARPQIMAIGHVLKNIKDVKMFDVVEEKARRFVEEMAPVTGLPIRVVKSAEEAVRDSDVVAPTTLVAVENAYIRSEWIKKGAFLANISDNDYTFDAVKKVDKIVIDGPKQFTIPVTLGEMKKRGLIDESKVYRIGAVINGKAPARERDDEIIFFSALGMGIHDLIVAKRVYENARQKGIGTTLKLWNEPKWV